MWEVLRSLGKSLASLVWALCLVPTIWVAVRWPSWDVLVADSLQWVVAFLICVLVLLAFAAWAPHRRRIVGTLMFATLLVDLSGLVEIRSIQVVAWAVVAVLVVVAFEVVRQNIGLVRELKQQDPEFHAKVSVALKYWTPMLFVAAIGGGVNYLIMGEAEQVVYDQTPIDQYCKSDRGPFPCEGFQTQTLPAKPLSVEASLAYHWEARFRARQQLLLEVIAPSDPNMGIPEAVFTDRQALIAELRKLDDQMKPLDVLGIKPGHLVTEAELLERDPVTQRLRQDQAALARQRATLRPRLGNLDKIITLDRRIGEVGAQLSRRRDELLAQNSDRLATVAQMKTSVQLLLNHRLSPGKALQLEQAMVAQNTEQVSTARAALAAVAVAQLATMKKSSGDTANVVIKEVLRANAQDGDALTWLRDDLEASGFPALCSNELERTDVKRPRWDAGIPTKSNAKPFDCNARLVGVGRTLEPVDWLDSVRLSLEHLRQNEEQHVETRTGEALVAIVGKVNQGQAGAMALQDLVPNHIHLGRKHCTLLKLGNCLTNYVKEKTESGYATARADAGAVYELKINEARQKGLSTAERVLLTRDFAREELRKAKEVLRINVQRVRTSLDVVSAVLLFFVLLTLIKSLLYTLAMKLYVTKGPSFVQVDPLSTVSGDSPRVAPVDPRDRALVFDDVATDSPLVTREYLANQEKYTKRTPPWPFSGVVSRLLHLRYYFFNAGGPLPDLKVTWDCGEWRYIVDWQLRPGEAVVFHYRYFIGASKHVRLESRVSLRLDTMLLGRFTFAVAVAPDDRPGHLLLAVKSLNPQAVADDSTESSMIERLAAWHAHTAFQATLTERVSSVYLIPSH